MLVTVIGSQSPLEATRLKKHCQESLAKGLNDFTFELKDCSALDDTFLGILIGLGLKLRATQGKLRIVNARPEISGLMMSLGLDRLLSFG